MALETFSQYIYHGTEERYLEYKISMPWSDIATKMKVTRAAMSMANIKDGGVLVFGIEKLPTGFYNVKGMDPKHWNSFNQDDVSEAVNEYADPYVNLKVNKKIIDDMHFVIIEIQEFDELPVVCKKDGQEVKRGEIYTRPRRKIESVPAPSQTDLREILEMAVDKRIRKYREIYFKWIGPSSFNLEDISKQEYTNQLRDLEDEKIIKKIASQAHWKVNLFPSNFEKRRIPDRNQLKDIMEKCVVSLKGWRYPHFYEQYIQIQHGDDWLQSSIDDEDKSEFWRFYLSGQFIHYMRLHEDEDFHAQEKGRARLSAIGIKNGIEGCISVLWTLSTITEIYEFAIRLAGTGKFDPRLFISIDLGGIKNYYLFFWDILNIIPQGHKYPNEKEIKIESDISVQELIAEGHDEAIEKTVDLLQRFEGYEPDIRLLKEEQRKFLERR